MKYQNINRSCSYAALANLLLEHDIDTEDKEIILKANIPYFFQYDTDTQKYSAGAMLQGKKWFDLYLKPRSLEFCEKIFERNELIRFWDTFDHPCMLGLKLYDDHKHAVIFQGKINQKYHFVNIKSPISNEPDYYDFTKDELVGLLDEKIYLGWITKISDGIKTNLLEEICNSKTVFTEYKKVVLLSLSEENDVQQLNKLKMNVYEAFFLDLASMLELIERIYLANQIVELRKQFQYALNIKKALKLSDYLSYDKVKFVLNSYQDILNKKISFI